MRLLLQCILSFALVATLAAGCTAEYEVSVDVEPEDAAEIEGVGTYTQGDTVTVRVQPEEEYDFLGWMEDDELVSEDEEYEFEVVQHRQLTAVFELREYEVAVKPDVEFEGSVSGGGAYRHGETALLKAVPEEGYEFKKWTKDGEKLSEHKELDVVVEGDVYIKAHFSWVDPASTVGLKNGEILYLESDTRQLRARPLSSRQGILLFLDKKVLLLDPQEGDTVWTVQGYRPILDHGVVLGPLESEVPAFVKDAAAVVPLYDYDYEGEKFDEVEAVPSLVKLALQTGEVIWEHPLARNTPPLMVTELMQKGDCIIAKGNFLGSADADNPVSGVAGSGLAAHNYETGELVHAFSGGAGSSIEVMKESFLYSQRMAEGMKLGEHDIFTGESKWEIPVKDSDAVYGITPAGNIRWETDGDIIESGSLPSVEGSGPQMVLVDDRDAHDEQLANPTLLVRRQTDGKAEIALIEAADGEVIKEHVIEDAPHVSAFSYQDQFFLFVQTDEGEATVKAIDSVSGEIQWEFGTEFAPDRGREVLRTSGHLLLREDDLVHLVDPKTGEAVSTFEMVSSGLVVYEGDFLYLVDEEYLRAVCPQVLQMVWKTELEDIVSEASGDDIEIFSDSDAKVLLGSEEEFSVLTKEDGRVLYSCEHDGSAKPLLLEEDKVFLAYSPEREMPAREGYMILVGPEK